VKKLVIFDVDGTLLDTERIYVKTWKEAGKLFGYEITDEVMLKTRALNKKMAMAIFHEALGSEFDYHAVRKERIRLSEECIEATPPEDLQLPHVAETLQLLADRKLPMAVASSSTYQETLDHLGHAELLRYFQAVVGGDMVQKGKPNPDIFLKAADLLGVPAADCLVVGDTPADVLAAHGAGMPMILIPDLVAVTEQTRALSSRILSSMAELPEVLDSFCK
jgi:DNA helicase-2/ATP-dependent DNA helicase PcrA